MAAVDRIVSVFVVIGVFVLLLVVGRLSIPSTQNKKFCIDCCGDGICQDLVCLGEHCPCPETVEHCPQDCK